MRIPETVFDDFAVLLSYPAPGIEQALVRVLMHFSEADMRVHLPEAHRALREFTSAAGALPTTELEELYTRTFDINPSASLEIGWHLYGEQYERGSFLVLMRQQLREYGVEEGSELPDHLTHVLRVLGRMDDSTREAMLDSSLLRAFDIMLGKWGEEDNPYKRCLDALCSILRSMHIHQQGVQANV